MATALDEILISSARKDFAEQIHALRRRLIEAAMFELDSPEYDTALNIVRDVAARGDKALIELTEKHDGVKLTPDTLKVSRQDLKTAHDEIDPKLLASLRQAIANVRKYQSEIFIGKPNTHPGIKYTPIRRVGVCVPGASAPLPSTVIMTVVPAQVAGVEQIVVVSPPRYKGSIHPVILAVCHELGIEEVYRVGGAQAVAAMACGAETIPKVDKIVGPGNRWVQTAKKLVLGYVGIDSIAGPSEVLIIADKNANPAWVAADMLSQAEHNPGSAVVATDSQDLADKTLAALKDQAAQLSRAKDTIQSLRADSRIVVFDSLDKAVDFANDFAPEHLQIQCGPHSERVAGKIQNAGAIFIGPYSPVAVGDYWAGPSHTLPTGAAARSFSALSSNDFVKSSSIIAYDKARLLESADDIIRLAMTEGLDAHAKSVDIRRQN
ncbi:MAG: histidinol dehydrogenase [Planctomycetota bacterium]|nr:MAG: histidinol dehydrogenase [Planctomycetota bacterium]